MTDRAQAFITTLGRLCPLTAIISGVFILFGIFIAIKRIGTRTKGEFWRTIRGSLFIIIFDFFSCAASYLFVAWAGANFSVTSVSPQTMANCVHYIIITCMAGFAVFYALKLYHSVWHYVGMHELYRMVASYLIVTIVVVASMVAEKILLNIDTPVAWILFSLLIMFAFQLGIRVCARLASELSNKHNMHGAVAVEKIMVVGAGDSGRAIINDFNGNYAHGGRVVCAIDDDKNKHGRLVEGVRIVGGREMIPAAARQFGISRIVVAIPSLGAQESASILGICKETGCHTQVVPGIYQLANGKVTVNAIRDVDVEDLLGREPVKIENEVIFDMVRGNTIMVTGGGGSIGSELCRQIAAHNPGCLVIFDIYENNAYDIQQELKRKYPDLNLVVLIGSVRNTHRITSVIEKYKPTVIFHAAAHKHVPLMEDSPNEAIKNNVIGTYKTAMAAINAGVGKFVLISTDKAVNPTNIMGASKRLCEMIVQSLGRKYKTTDFALVRFGNVLGSNGSVIPLFKKQIAEGGPVTVTDPNIIRFFMTIPEAASLVLRAAGMAHGGEIFVLDMGAPVRIDDLARNLIRLSGYIPDADIKIEYTGLRPGEKLYEEMLMSEEGLTDTEDALIHIGQPIVFDDDKFIEDIKRLDEASKSDSDNIKAIVAELVPTYKLPNK